MNALKSSALPGLLFVLAVLWTSSSAQPAQASDSSGLWKGRWTATGPGGRAHSGTLRMRLRPAPQSNSGHYKAIFAGRFAVVIPYAYRADVYQNGNSLVSTRRLGPLGEYTMRLSGTAPQQLSGSWTAMGQGGKISLRRR